MTKLLLATDRQLQFEDVQFAFRPNLAGRKEKYNAEGNRYFNIKIQSQEEAEMLRDMGFNIKFSDSQKMNERRVLNGRDPLDEDMLEDFWFLKVPIYTTYAPPTIQVRDTTDIPELDEEVDDAVFLPVELFGDVDTMETKNIDVIITYRQPHPENGTYLRPQLKSMFIDVETTPLQRKHMLR